MAEIRDVPAVALLFADVELAGHLREALTALGAHIVHQGAVMDVSADVLRKSGADVVVVNLEPADEEHLEHLYAALEGGSCQVVFNDAEASRNLSGWDKARWARHLAAKLVGSSDVDPPRPAQARAIEVQAGVVVAGPAPSAELAMAADVQTPANALSDTPVPADSPEVGTEPVKGEVEQSMEFEAELEALLSDNESPEEATQPAVEPAPPAPTSGATDESSLRDVDIEERHIIATPSPASDWELIDMKAAPPTASGPTDPRQFGIDKVSAESYLKPEGDDQAQASPLEAGLKLELVSLEESVAPTMTDEPASEMLLVAGIERAVVVSLGAGGVAALEILLSGLPVTLPAVLVLLAPADGPSMQTLTETLGNRSTRPVVIAHDDSRVGHGSVLLVPPGHTCRLGRDGRIGLLAPDIMAGPLLIEQCLVDAADTLAAGLTAIVLAGTDHGAVAGAHHVHDKGGQVWIQNPASCAGDPTTTAIQNAGLAAFVGSPAELARHLCEASQ